MREHRLVQKNTNVVVLKKWFIHGSDREWLLFIPG